MIVSDDIQECAHLFTMINNVLLLVIKTPMDLSTVLKKLKAFQYFDKQDFAKDLDLIWENCLLYNTSPDSIYRVHALKMREKCEHALKRVIEEEEEEEAEEESVIEEIGMFKDCCSIISNTLHYMYIYSCQRRIVGQLHTANNSCSNYCTY